MKIEHDELRPVEVRLLNLMGIVYSGHWICTWCFSGTTRHLYYSSAIHESQLEKLFCLGGCQDYAFGEARELSVPFLMSDRLGLIWLGENIVLSNGSPMLVLMGPMFYASTSQEYLRTRLSSMASDREIPFTEVTAYRSVLSDVPIVSAQTALAYARMLHYTVTFKTLAPGDVHYQTQELLRDSAPVKPGDRSWADYSLVHSQEEMFLQCVREGNLNYMDVINSLNYSVLDLPLSGNPVRSELYKVVANAALCTRAAIEGGLSPKIAIDLETRYLREADKLTRVTELRELNVRLLDDFIRHVHQARNQGDISRHIQECCEYIATHLTDDLSIQRIAGQIGYAEYYLTRKFQKEMGVKLTDYIKDARLDYAKVCLLSTELSVEEISELLQFSSRNYFTRVFREKTGKTPTEFRTQHNLAEG